MERSAPQHAAWTVSDGRAGNARQARALAAAMGLATIGGLMFAGYIRRRK